MYTASFRCRYNVIDFFVKQFSLIFNKYYLNSSSLKIIHFSSIPSASEEVDSSYGFDAPENDNLWFNINCGIHQRCEGLRFTGECIHRDT